MPEIVPGCQHLTEQSITPLKTLLTHHAELGLGLMQQVVLLGLSDANEDPNL